MAFKLKSSGSSPFLETTNKGYSGRNRKAEESGPSEFIKRPESPKKVNRATNTDWLNSDITKTPPPPPPPKKPVITGKIGSDLRRQQYKTAGYKADDTVKKAKVKTVEPIKAKGVVGKEITTANIKRKAGSTEALKSKPVEKKAPKLAARKASAPKVSRNDARKTRKINKKLSQAAEARASGNEKKALRKEKAAARKASRLSKK